MSKTQNYTITYDRKGTVIEASDELLTLLDCSKQDIIGTSHKNIVQVSFSSPIGYQNFWDDLLAGKTRDEGNFLKIKNKNYKIFETYIPKRNSKGVVSKIISYLDVFIEGKPAEHDLLEKTETHMADKTGMNDKLNKLIAEQEEMALFLKKLKEKNEKRMRDLDEDSKKLDFYTDHIKNKDS